jgi:hypothetical protein
MHAVVPGGRLGRILLILALCACALLLLPSTKGKIGRGTGSGSHPANSPAGPERYIERYPEPEHDVPPTLEQLAKQRVYEYDPKQGVYLDGFTLWTVDDLTRFAPEQQECVRLTGRKLDNGDYHLVVHVKEAPVLTYLFIYVRYEQDQWHPRSCEPGSLFGFEGDRLWYSKVDVPGVVCAGMARVRPDLHGGTKVSDGVMCEIVFKPSAYDYKPFWLDHAPDGKRNRPHNIQAYQDPVECTPVLYWEETNEGDFNNDGEVSMADILPVAFRYGRMSTDGHEDVWDRLVDGNADGEINRRDAWLLEANYGALLQGYRVYRRPAGRPRGEEQLLKHRTAPILPFSIHRPVEWAPAQPVAYRYYDKELPLTDAPAEWIYRIVPYDAADNREGEDSDVEVRVRVSRTLVELLAAPRKR